MFQGLRKCSAAIFILGLIGTLIGIWMMSGTVPTIFYFGLKIISPQWFLPSCLLLTILVSSFTGSALTTVGTVGVALMGIAQGFGIPAPHTAGAVICGACFGDKVSPLSDTTNFAPAVVGVDLFAHIEHLLGTTIPALVLTFIFFIYLSHGDFSHSQTVVHNILLSLESSFNISILTLISPLIITSLAMMRFPTIPILSFGVVTGLLTAGFVQSNWDISQWLVVLLKGFSDQSGNHIVDNIVNRGGLSSMLFSISLIVVALCLGGLLQSFGVIISLMEGLKGKVRKRGAIVSCTAASSIGVNFLTGEQYLSILLPGQAFKALYQEQKIATKTLSRTLEDAGTLVNPLVPWGVSGTFFANALHVPVSQYIPFVVFLYLSPLFTIAFAYLPERAKNRN